MSPAPLVQDEVSSGGPKALPKPDDVPKHQEEDDEDDEDEEGAPGEAGAAGAFY